MVKQKLQNTCRVNLEFLMITSINRNQYLHKYVSLTKVYEMFNATKIRELFNDKNKNKN